MAKLYFKYGAMGSSKTAQALITKYNYEENGMNVWLLKPSADTRDGEDILRSRIGLEAKVEVATPETDIYQNFVENHLFSNQNSGIKKSAMLQFLCIQFVICIHVYYFFELRVFHFG